MATTDAIMKITQFLSRETKDKWSVKYTAQLELHFMQSRFRQAEQSYIDDLVVWRGHQNCFHILSCRRLSIDHVPVDCN